ncbi:signaling lymphocytic activation molecule-like [Halichoeres trimaculatus]|uniref:signaling lymphocytic activation molecule-like n=1 Tax=Halichoeres trimaculatus TaxID=147232 RepID=UPI003D9F0473
MEQMKIIFLFIMLLSSAAEDIKSNLTRVQGESVTFPDPVLKKGFFSFEGNTIASVGGGKHEILEEIYKDRLFWDDKTGLFTLRGLERNDSGIYKIESRDGEGVSTYHKLTVYEPVSAPEVRKLNVSTESCTLLCEVQEAEETTLFWYRDTEILNQSSLALSLPLTVEDFTPSYRCVAENPAENKTVYVNARPLCDPGGANSRRFFLVPALLLWGAAAVGFAVMSIKRQRKRKRDRERERETEGADLN